MILAVDPGPTPGMAVWDGGTFRAWTADSPADAEDYLWSMAPELDEIAIEDFVITPGGRPKTTADINVTIELIGSVAFLCRHFSIPLHRQKPGDASSFSTNDKLKALGWVTPSKPDHARSAARHLLLHLTRTGTIDPLELLGKMQETKEEQCR